MISTLRELPDIDFVNTDVDQLLDRIISGYEKAYYESTGKRKKLYPGDPVRIWLYSQALRELQLRVIIDDAAKQNLLKYARKDNLQHIGALSRTELLKATHSQTRMKITLSHSLQTNEVIPVNTRVSPGSDVYFEITEEGVIPSGQTEIELSAICTRAGEVGNGFPPGQINILVDPLPWVDFVENTETSHGGADEEDVESYRERIYLAPEGFSVAGPEGAYIYHAKKYSALIDDLKVDTPSPGEVEITTLLEGGEIPSEGFLQGLSNHLNDREVRPLTDRLSLKAPSKVSYDLEIEYFIGSVDYGKESEIVKRIERAVDNYINWQKSKIDRDINPSVLTSMVIDAGAKRVEVTSPSFTRISGRKVASVYSEDIVYGGLEDE